MVSTDYLDEILTPEKYILTVNKIVNYLEPLKNKFDAVVIANMSGFLVGPHVSSLIKKPFIIVRNPKWKTHSTKVVEGIKVEKYCILDDVVEEGKTLQYIVDEKFRFNPAATCTAIYLYGTAPPPIKSFRGVPIYHVK